jgi:hypothetical protein
MDSRQEIFQEIDAERIRQDRLWGEQNHGIKPVDRESSENFMFESIISKNACDIATRDKNLTWWHILKEEFDEVFAEDAAKKQREELIHLTAVAVHMIECIDLQQKSREKQ